MNADWRPMETAPKDVPILVWYDDAAVLLFREVSRMLQADFRARCPDCGKDLPGRSIDDVRTMCPQEIKP
jgi:hypothetical protein